MPVSSSTSYVSNNDLKQLFEGVYDQINELIENQIALPIALADNVAALRERVRECFMSHLYRGEIPNFLL